MQLKRALFLVVLAMALVFSAHAAMAQSLSPMHKTGTTPTDIKGFKLVVGNPYPGRMTFIITPMNPQFTAVADDAIVRPNEIRLAPGSGRTVTVQFRIGVPRKERTIGVCVVPKDLEGPVLPRVCGTYTGVIIGNFGG
jgi:hypothetical protein